MNSSQTHQGTEIFSTIPHYHKMIQESCNATNFEEVCRKSFPKWIVSLARRHKRLLILLTVCHVLRNSYHIIVGKFPKHEIKFAMYFDMVFRPSMKRFVLVEFMPAFRNNFTDRINGFVLRRTAKRIQVLTRWEKEQYARRFNLPPHSFNYIPWWLSANGEKPGSEGTIGVVSSGRSGCDWNTLFKAANGRDWALTVICSKSDLKCVSKLNSRKRARAFLVKFLLPCMTNMLPWQQYMFYH